MAKKFISWSYHIRMAQTIQVKIQASNKESQGTVTAQLWTPEEQSKRAWRGFGIMFGLAIASVFLPLVHFILVPSFLIGSPFVYHWFKKQKGRIIALSAKCPFCQKELSVRQGNLEWPLRFPCKGCFEQLRVFTLDN